MPEIDLLGYSWANKLSMDAVELLKTFASSNFQLIAVFIEFFIFIRLITVKVGLFNLNSVFQTLNTLKQTKKLIIAITNSKSNVMVKKLSILRELDSINTESTFYIESLRLDVEVCESFYLFAFWSKPFTWLDFQFAYKLSTRNFYVLKLSLLTVNFTRGLNPKDFSRCG